MNKNITPTMVVLLLALVPGAMGGLYAGETSGRSMTRVQYDNAHTGWNPDEVVLNVKNVNPKTFAKKWEIPLDGNIKGAPLYVSGVMINGQSHNVVFVATSSNLIYALDADTGQSVWEKPYFLDTPGINENLMRPPCGDVGPIIGIVSTPVIDPDSGTLYAVGLTC